MTSASASPPGAHPDEPHDTALTGRLNRLRAGVLGANEGTVSVASLVVGVEGVTAATPAILTAGAAGSSAARSRWRSASTSRSAAGATASAL